MFPHDDDDDNEDVDGIIKPIDDHDVNDDHDDVDDDLLRMSPMSGL